MLRTIALEENITSRLAISGDSLHIVDAAGSVNVSVNFMESTKQTQMLAGLGTNYLEPYSVIEMTSPITQKVVIWAGFGELVDRRNRAFISGSSELMSTGKAIQENSGRVLLLDKRLNRSSVLITSNEKIYIGGPQVTQANGIAVHERQSLTLKTQAAIYAVAMNDTGAHVRTLEEIN